MESILDIRDAEEDGYFARALGYAISTEADTWDELRTNVLEAAALDFENAPVRQRPLCLRYRRDEPASIHAE